VNKAQLVEQVSRKSGVGPADVAKVIDTFTATVAQAVAKGDKVLLSGFGTFHRKPRARRTARNIWADQAVVVPATNVPAYRPGKPFREAVAVRRRPRLVASTTSSPRKRPARRARAQPRK
jgi:DNA-binding protein HU-beta